MTLSSQEIAALDAAVASGEISQAQRDNAVRMAAEGPVESDPIKRAEAILARQEEKARQVRLATAVLDEAGYATADIEAMSPDERLTAAFKPNSTLQKVRAGNSTLLVDVESYADGTTVVSGDTPEENLAGLRADEIEYLRKEGMIQ